MQRIDYPGYELPPMSLLEARQFARELRERLEPVAARQTNRWFSEKTVKLLDAAHFTPAPRLRAIAGRILGRRNITTERDLGGAPAPFLVNEAFVAARSSRVRELDMRAWLDLYPLERTTLALVEAPNDAMRTAAITDTRFEDCVFYTNDVPPEGISETEWIRREALWRATMRPSGDDRMERMRMKLHGPDAVNLDEQFRPLPGHRSLHERVVHHAKNLVIEARLHKLVRSLKPGDDDTRLYPLALDCQKDADTHVSRIVAGILSEHLPEKYASDGTETEAMLGELFDPALHRRLRCTLDTLPEIDSQNPDTASPLRRIGL